MITGVPVGAARHFGVSMFEATPPHVIEPRRWLYVSRILAAAAQDVATGRGSRGRD